MAGWPVSEKWDNMVEYGLDIWAVRFWVKLFGVGRISFAFSRCWFRTFWFPGLGWLVFSLLMILGMLWIIKALLSGDKENKEARESMNNEKDLKLSSQ